MGEGEGGGEQLTLAPPHLNPLRLLRRSSLRLRRPGARGEEVLFFILFEIV
jgi:hypothetical protein